MKKGDLNRRIAILLSADEDDGLSSGPGEPVEIGRRWAKKTDVSDGERIRASQQGQELTSRFLVLSDSVTRTIDARHVITCEGVSYEIVGTKEVEGMRNGIEITVTSRPDRQP